MGPRRLDALTGLRFFAAFQVVLFHFGGVLTARAPAAVENVRSAGYTAVSFFFVLSGFILAYHYLLPSRRVTARDFWVTRASRIYPVYLAALLLLVPLAVSPTLGGALFAGEGVARKAVTFVAHAALVHAWLPGLALSWNLPGWSIGCEAFFYLLFPLVAVRLFARMDRARLVAAMAFLWSTSMFMALAYVALDPDHVGHATRFTSGFWLVMLKFSPLARLPEFLFGVALGKLYLDRRDAGRLGDGRIFAPVGLGFVMIGLIVSPRLPYPLLHDGLLVPAFALTIWGLAEGGGTVGRVLSARPLVFLGEASYALYILQLPVMQWVLRATRHQSPTELSAGYILGYIALLVGLSALSFKYMERPLQKLLRAKFLATRPVVHDEPPKPVAVVA